MRGEVFIDEKFLTAFIGEIHGGLPRRAMWRFTRAQFAEHHDVGGHFRAGVFLEGGVGQTDCAEKFRLGAKQFAQR